MNMLTYLLLLLSDQIGTNKDYCQAPGTEPFFKKINQLLCGALITLNHLLYGRANNAS